MRYYGEEYKSYISKSIKDVHDSIKDPDYASNVRRVDVSSKNAGLKTQCVNAAGTASSHVDSIRGKLENLIDVLNTFYLNADATSDDVLKVAKEIRELLNETNAALVRMNGAVNGIGKYTGTKVTPDILIDAGLDIEKCDKFKATIWDRLFTIQSADGKISYDAAVAFVDYINNLQKNGLDISKKLLKHMDAVFGVYIEKMKSLDPDKIPPKDMERLETIHAYYCKFRFGSKNDIESIDDQALKNGVNVYELLNPDAKKITDDFFIDAYKMSDNDIDSNILRIKYILYTADADERDVMLNALPYMKLNILEPGEGASTTGGDKKAPVLNLDLRKGDVNRCCSFFHEFGHGLDILYDVPSEKYTDVLVRDLKNHMRKVLIEKGFHLHPDKEQEVIDNFFTSENYNIVDSKGKDWPYPPHWTSSQAAAYYQLRDYYGYAEYKFYNPKDPNFNDKNDPNKKKYVPYKKVHGSGALGGKPEGSEDYDEREYIILADVGGGLTNYKIGDNARSHGLRQDDFPTMNRLTKPYNVHYYLAKKTYYFSNAYKKDDNYKALTQAAGNEFFAESWNYDIMNTNKEPTRKIFPTACDNYEKTIEEIKRNPLKEKNRIISTAKNVFIHI